jgi:hypothetical protein
MGNPACPLFFLFRTMGKKNRDEMMEEGSTRIERNELVSFHSSVAW